MDFILPNVTYSPPCLPENGIITSTVYHVSIVCLFATNLLSLLYFPSLSVLNMTVVAHYTLSSHHLIDPFDLALLMGCAIPLRLTSSDDGSTYLLEMAGRESGDLHCCRSATHKTTSFFFFSDQVDENPMAGA